MLRIRYGKDRGNFDHGWLRTFHSFSFSEYFDPQHVHFGPLRVINEDFVAAGEGFPTHGHKDMEIITYIIKGALKHKDSTGGEGTISPGEVQKMSAGKGVLHSEFNALENEETHLFQIWIFPDQKGISPNYEQKDFSPILNQGEPTLIVSKNGEAGSIRIQQDAKVWVKRFTNSQNLEWKLNLDPTRKFYVQILKGKATVGSHSLQNGDAVALEQESGVLLIQGEEHSEIMIFDLTQ